MASSKQKYYVVWQGHNPGIYTSWEAARGQVSNFPGAKYKAYSSKADADYAFKYGEVSKPSTVLKKTEKLIRNEDEIKMNSISVDAACSGNPGAMEYRGVWTSDKSEIFHLGPIKNGTNNIGEFLAIVHALALLKSKNDETTPVYTDSKTALSWVRRKKANTKLKPDKFNHQLFSLIQRAEVWLKNNNWKNQLLKWDTANWGEIPADFDRK